MDTRTKSTRILMLPYPTHDHITPFLSLAKSLTKTNFIIYICSTSTNLNSIKSTLSEKYSISIKLVHLQPAFSTLIQTLKPDILVYDYLLPWAPHESLLHGVPPIVFFTTGANCLATENENVVELEDQNCNSTRFGMIRSVRELEGKCIDYLSELTGKRIVPVGPLVLSCSKFSSGEMVVVTKWLDEKEERSVIYVSFGSSNEREIREIVLGVYASGYSFVWVVGDEHEKVRIENVVDGRVGDEDGKGIVVVESGLGVHGGILGHESIGGLLSDCGWGSIMEGISFGVTIIGVPGIGDRERLSNGRLMEEFGVGKVVVRKGEGYLDKEELGRVVKDESLQRKVQELRECVRKKENDVDAVVEELVAVLERKERSCLCSENSMNMLNQLSIA